MSLEVRLIELREKLPHWEWSITAHKENHPWRRIDGKPKLKPSWCKYNLYIIFSSGSMFHRAVLEKNGNSLAISWKKPFTESSLSRLVIAHVRAYLKEGYVASRGGKVSPKRRLVATCLLKSLSKL